MCCSGRSVLSHLSQYALSLVGFVGHPSEMLFLNAIECKQVGRDAGL